MEQDNKDGYTAEAYVTEVRTVEKDGTPSGWMQHCPDAHSTLDAAMECHKRYATVLARTGPVLKAQDAMFLAAILDHEEGGRTVELRLVKFTTTREIICSGERLN